MKVTKSPQGEHSSVMQQEKGTHPELVCSQSESNGSNVCHLKNYHQSTIVIVAA